MPKRSMEIMMYISVSYYSAICAGSDRGVEGNSTLNVIRDF